MKSWNSRSIKRSQSRRLTDYVRNSENNGEQIGFIRLTEENCKVKNYETKIEKLRKWELI